MLTTEDRIIMEAGDLFFRHGIRSITMDDIAAQMGISKKTIYQCFKDKDMLVLSFAEKILARQLEDMNMIRKSSENAIDEILKTMAHLSKFLQMVNPSFIHDMRKFHPTSWKLYKRFIDEELISYIEDNLKRGMKQGLYRKDLKVKILSRMRLAETNLGFDPEVFPLSQFNFVEVQLTMLEHFLYGILSQKGFQVMEKFPLIKKDN